MDTTEKLMMESKTRLTKRLVVVAIFLAVVMDNVLYMVVHAILPNYLRSIEAFQQEVDITSRLNRSDSWYVSTSGLDHNIDGGKPFGILFAAKAIFQLVMNPVSEVLIDKTGYTPPMMIGLVATVLANMFFSFGKSYGLLFVARSLQGIGFAFIDTAGFAMVIDRYPCRSKRDLVVGISLVCAVGIRLTFTSFRFLMMQPFTGLLFLAGMLASLLIIAFVPVPRGTLCLLACKHCTEDKWQRPGTMRFFKYIVNPYIAFAAWVLSVSNVAVAFQEPTMSIAMVAMVAMVAFL
ncbi:vesicular acetylcholine transporter-like [Diadema antillarum]|uniref:vesicular acetylcholine transporter-like n=1 Tax=Diadema antillarum TaxID=105358 RepID=UPI003A88FA67